MFNYTESMKSHRSGRMGEKFCEEVFGIKEPSYEIKSSGAKTGCVVIQCWQLLEQLEKQYVIVRYFREKKTISRGPNKGKQVFTETVEEGYKHKLKICVIRGFRLMEIVLRNKLVVYCTARNGNIMHYGKWGCVWRVPVKDLPFDDGYLVHDEDRYALYALDDDPPGWMGEHVVRVQQHGLFSGGNGKPVPKPTMREEEWEEEVGFEDEVPF